LPTGANRSYWWSWLVSGLLFHTKGSYCLIVEATRMRSRTKRGFYEATATVAEWIWGESPTENKVQSSRIPWRHPWWTWVHWEHFENVGLCFCRSYFQLNEKFFQFKHLILIKLFLEMYGNSSRSRSYNTEIVKKSAISNFLKRNINWTHIWILILVRIGKNLHYLCLYCWICEWDENLELLLLYYIELILQFWEIIFDNLRRKPSLGNIYPTTSTSAAAVASDVWKLLWATEYFPSRIIWAAGYFSLPRIKRAAKDFHPSRLWQKQFNRITDIHNDDPTSPRISNQPDIGDRRLTMFTHSHPKYQATMLWSWCSISCVKSSIIIFVFHISKIKITTLVALRLPKIPQIIKGLDI